MSAQILELLFFAGIAFLIINKLIATLGLTSDNDPQLDKKNSYFGEKSLKKNTANSGEENVILGVFEERPGDELDNIIIHHNAENIIKNFANIKSRLQSFDPSKFLRNAKAAFTIIIEASKDNSSDLDKLIDKRFLEKFDLLAQKYGKFNHSATLEGIISDVYMFGNNAFIKVIFTGQNILENMIELKEEWTFSKNLTNKEPVWYLCNVDIL